MDPLTERELADHGLAYLRENVSRSIVQLSPGGVEHLMNLHYPTGWDGFVCDSQAAGKTC